MEAVSDQPARLEDFIPETLMTAEEVASWLNVKESWVYSAAGKGLIPCVRAGRWLRFRRAAVEQWIEDGGNPGGDDDA